MNKPTMASIPTANTSILPIKRENAAQQAAGENGPQQTPPEDENYYRYRQAQAQNFRS